MRRIIAIFLGAMRAFLFFLLCVPALCVLNCTTSPGGKSGGVRTDRSAPKKADPKKQVKCNKIGSGKCGKDCQKICNDIFSGSTEKECEKLSASLVSAFDKIIKDVKDGNAEKVRQINKEALNCLLDMDDQKFVKSIKSMSSSEARAFLTHIVEDEKLALILKEEDDEFNIIEQLLYESAGENSALRAMLRKGINDEGQSFLWFSASEGNEPAFDHLDAYVEDRCSRDKAHCAGFNHVEAMGGYCPALLSFSTAKLSDFLSSAGLFEARYESMVERAGYEYMVSDTDYKWHEEYKGDFRDFCSVEPYLTEGERRLGSQETKNRYFNEEICKQNLKPAGFVDADNSGAVDSADTTRIWNLKNCASDSPYTCITDTNHADYFTGYSESEYVWNYGNVYGNTRGAFGPERLLGVGQSFWYLNAEKKIINPFINEHFGIFVKRAYIYAPNDPPKDPKTGKARRASFMFYIPTADDTDYPNCTRVAGDPCKCLYSYCLLDYELKSDNTVKSCNVIKCALGRPSSHRCP